MTGPGRPHDLPGVLVALVMLCLGVVFIRQTGSMTPMGSVFPITISAAMVVFSALLILRAFILGRSDRPEAKPPLPDEPPTRGATARRIAFFAVMVGWVALIPVLGFFATSLAAFLLVMAVSIHERTPVRQLWALAAIGVVVVGAFYLLMREVLLIPLPRGLFF